jgi:hypothetical protein
MESCPNSVIEAILCGCKVISGSCGGTKELLNSDDVICNIDPKFNFKQHGEVMDSGLGNVVSGAIKKAINTSFSKIKDRSRYSIKKCTDNYVDFIKSRVLK